MNKITSFIFQQVFPGLYAQYVNKGILRKSESHSSFNIDISDINGNEEEYITQIKNDLGGQLERKKRIEDKAKSLLFIIAVSVTAITFSLSYLKSLKFDIYQVISLSILFVSVIYLVLGAIRALQALNIRKFYITQTNVEEANKVFILRKKKENEDHLKDLIKSKQLNDLINIQLSNFTYASFNLIRNGIILIVVFFISTISFSILSKKPKTFDRHSINKEIKVKINDSLKVNIPYKLELIYDVKNLEFEQN